MFASPIDIANRALQQCGVSRIADFTEDSLQASETSFCYDKLRRAELRRNVWRFAIRNAALRPIDATTMLLAPTLWASTTTYGFGALVTDSDGVLWQSAAQDNLNNAPGNSATWEVYCGPMSVSPYDTTGKTGYFSGELVYETPGDGTYTTYLSLQNGNTQDPRAPSGWISTVVYKNDDVVIYYAAWAVGTTYAAGKTIRDVDIYYVSLVAGNLGNTPASSPVQWAAISTTLAPAYYDSTVAYTIGQFVTYSGLLYVCVLASTGNLPTNATYWAAQEVGTYYASLLNFNLNNNPASSPTLWTATNPFGKANRQWLQLAVTITNLQIIYPMGTGPLNQSFTKNIYRLPANFLRRAPQDPKAGSVSPLGAPSGLPYDDWTLQGQYFVTRESYPIALRFVADVTDVTTFDDMFCEGLAARIAAEVVERLTQSTAKRAGIMAAYRLTMGEARIVNGIETGATEPPEDDYITCRA